MLLHISLCTLEKEIKKKKLEVVTVDKNKFDDAGVEEFAIIASKEENKFEGSVSEYAAQLTKNPGLAAAQVVVQHQVQVRQARGDEDRDHHQRGGEQDHRDGGGRRDEVYTSPGTAAAHSEVQHPGEKVQRGRGEEDWDHPQNGGGQVRGICVE